MMDEVQWQLRPLFKEHGFRMRLRTCNHTTADGIVHVINFQMGRHDPPGTYEIPGLRENLYGRFTVNVGIYVPEIASVRYGKKTSDFAQEVDCCIRRRLAQLASDSDLWWDLPAMQGALADLRLRLERHALPFLAKHEDRTAVLRQLESEVDGTGGPPRIFRAIILGHRGEIEQARKLLQEQIHGASAEHIKHVQDIADRLNLGRIEPNRAEHC